MQKLLLILCYSIITSFFSSSKKTIKEISAYSQSWSAGLRGGGKGVDYYFQFKILTAKKIEFDTLWINNRAFKTYLTNNKKTLSDKAITFLKNDTITVRASELMNEHITIIQNKAPITYKGEALLKYRINKKNNYYIIKTITKKSTINRP